MRVGLAGRDPTHGRGAMSSRLRLSELAGRNSNRSTTGMRASFMPSGRCAMLMPLVRASALQPCAIAAGWQISGPGGVAEWSKALVLKTSEPRGSVGSNPTPTATSPETSHCIS